MKLLITTGGGGHFSPALAVIKALPKEWQVEIVGRKYAFEGDVDGAIFVQLKKVGEKIKMVVSDNGKGMPKHINYKNTETLGLQLVLTLTEQINGNIRMERNKGTIFEIIF